MVLAKDVPEIFSGRVEVDENSSDKRGGMNESLYRIPEPGEVGGYRGSQSSGFFAGMVRSGQKSSGVSMSPPFSY